MCLDVAGMLLLFNRSVVSNSLQPHGLQHTRLPCPSLSLEFSQTPVYWVDDVIQPSHLLSSPSPPVFSLSKHQGLFQWVGSLHQVAKVLELQRQHQSFQWIQGWFPLGLTRLISFLSKGLSRLFSSTTVQKHQFFGPQQRRMDACKCVAESLCCAPETITTLSISYGRKWTCYYSVVSDSLWPHGL